MPKMKSWESYSYEPRPMTHKPAGKTAYDQTQRSPTTEQTGRGLYGGLGPKVTGGNMNRGGKRRPRHDASQGVD